MDKERHNIWFERKTWDRLVLLSKKSGKSLSIVANRAIESYKRTEIEDHREKKKKYARQMALLQAKMKLEEEAERASVDNSSV